MRSELVALALLLGGCDALFRLDHVPTQDTAPRDGKLDGSQHDADVASDALADDPDAQIPDGQCAPSYGSSRYLVSAILTDAFSAESECESLTQTSSPRYSHLAIVSSVTERALLDQRVSASDRPWIGLVRGSDTSSWRWVSSEVVITIPWAANQPDNAGGNQGCGLIVPGVGLDDEACTNYNRFICECDFYPPKVQ